jgi:hypothetical protein
VDVVFAVPRAKTSKLIVRKGYLEDDKWITTGQWKKRFLPFGQKGYTLVTISDELEDIDLQGKN